MGLIVEQYWYIIYKRSNKNVSMLARKNITGLLQDRTSIHQPFGILLEPYTIKGVRSHSFDLVASGTRTKVTRLRKGAISIEYNHSFYFYFGCRLVRLYLYWVLFSYSNTSYTIQTYEFVQFYKTTHFQTTRPPIN